MLQTTLSQLETAQGKLIESEKMAVLVHLMAGIAHELNTSEILPRIFEPFFTTRPQGEGSGLGLGICQQIVEKHGGQMGVTSQPGQTIFKVSLTLVVQQAA